MCGRTSPVVQKIVETPEFQEGQAHPDNKSIHYYHGFWLGTLGINRLFAVYQAPGDLYNYGDYLMRDLAVKNWSDGDGAVNGYFADEKAVKLAVRLYNKRNKAK
jgi:hypothetical protein